MLLYILWGPVAERCILSKVWSPVFGTSSPRHSDTPGVNNWTERAEPCRQQRRMLLLQMHRQRRTAWVPWRQSGRLWNGNCGKRLERWRIRTIMVQSWHDVKISRHIEFYLHIIWNTWEKQFNCLLHAGKEKKAHHESSWPTLHRRFDLASGPPSDLVQCRLKHVNVTSWTSCSMQSMCDRQSQPVANCIAFWQWAKVTCQSVRDYTVTQPVAKCIAFWQWARRHLMRRGALDKPEKKQRNTWVYHAQ